MSYTGKFVTHLLPEEKRKLLAQLLQKKVNKPQFPLSFAQQRLWFLDQMQPGAVYNIPAALRLTGLLNTTALEQSLNEIVRRHEILRTTFTAIKGQPFQRIAPSLTLTLPLIDLQEMPPDRREREVLEKSRDEALQSFDLARGPLLRSTLLKLHTAEHVLLFTMHHIISDYWSMRVLIRELATLYEAFCGGQHSPLPELAIQYVDFAVWQRQWLQGEARSAQLAYWQKQLGSHPPVLQLPTDRPRPVVQTFRGATQAFSLPTKLTKTLKTLSRQEDVTLFMTLLAAFKTLLYRYTSQEDIVIGSTVANRNRAEIEQLIGIFVNNLVLRTHLGENPSFRGLLRRVREIVLGAYTHQDLPFDYLVEELQPERNLSHNPLFQVMFILHNTSTENLKLPGLIWSYQQPEIQTARFDLSLDMYETPSELTGVFEYNTDLFDAATINRMVEHFCTLLSSIVVNPDQGLSDLPLLSEAERQQLVVWNSTQTEDSQDKCVQQLFEEQVERTPDAVAVVFEQALTYRELNTRANRLAYYLQALGVKPEVLVGICVERSLLMVVGLLGILKAGGAYVPLDPAYPKERLALMLEDSQVAILLTQKQLESVLPQHQAQVICLDGNWEEIAAMSERNPTSQVNLENLAYVIYTSGSTGQPKGVQIMHSALANFLCAMRQINLIQSDVLLSVTTLSFDIAALEIYLPLIVGARLIVAACEVTTDGRQLLKQLVESGTTVMQATPATWRLLLAAGWQGNRLGNRLKILCGGEALEYQLANQLLERGKQLWNLYGPTETTIWSAFYKIETQNSKGKQLGIIPIGCPIANTQFYILDSQQQPVPIGVAGELHIGGIGLARGYLNQAALTASKFIPNSFSDKPGSRLYKTGDLARYQADGNIEYIGRIDEQIKIRGFRIELGDIEAAISQHPTVQASAVVVQDESDDQNLVAYVVPKPDVVPTLDLSTLRRCLEEKLPRYMIPTFVTREALPLLPNGKVDRRSLKASRLVLEQSSNITAPSTPIEEMLAGIWASVLNLEQVGIYDNFFELGGHSLLATRVISQLREVFRLELPLIRLFEQPTIAGIAQEIATATSAGLGIEVPPLQPLARSGELPLSFAQQRLWFLAQLEPGSSYNIPAAVRLKGLLNIACLQQSLNEILCRHEVLRTNFKTVEGKPVQLISPAAKCTLPVIDLSELPPTQQQAETRQLAFLEAQQPFALDADLLLRVKLLRLSQQEHVVLLTVHHIVADGWSIGVFVHEVSALYQAFCHGQPSLLPQLPIQYADFAAWQRQWLQAEVLEAQLAYWRQQLQDIPAVLLPTDHTRPAVSSGRGARHAFQLPKERSQALKTFSQQEGCTLFMTLLAAFLTLLYRYTGSDDIVVGSPIANRNRTEVEGLIGCFVNTLALRINLASNPSFQELLKRVRQVALEAYTHQDLPFEQLVEELQPRRSLSHTPLFQVMFVLQAPLQPIELSGLTWSPLDSHSGTAKFDLTLYMTETNEGLVGSLEYNTDLFEAQTIQRMAQHFQTLLAGIGVAPLPQVSDLPLLTKAELHQVLAVWNNTQTEYPQDRCLHELFAEQVERTPTAIAVVCENQQLTYRELNAKANCLAHHLRSLGVGPEVLVGICLERSLLMVVGLLGILKAGGVYLPLDPVYPKQRLTLMLEDAQVSVLLTEQELLTEIPAPAHVVCLDTDWAKIAHEEQTNPVTEVQPKNLAYVIYTSGSTGKPKGVAIEHCNSVALLAWAQTAFTKEQLRGVLASTSICFDLSVFELFVPLSWGGKVILAENALHLPTLPAAEEVTLINTVPSLLVELLRVNGLPAGVQTVNLAGEPLPNRLVQQLYQQQTIQQVFNLYGPTEDTTYSTCALCISQPEVSQTSPIGYPITNTQAYILDRHLQLVPVGVPGEMYIGGAGLARGYLNRPELTAEKFIPNPFSNQPGTRLYKSGDLARYLADGNIEYLGRLDNQVKIRGFRIELEEIAAVLMQHPEVQTATVMVKEDKPGNKRLVAYVVPEETGKKQEVKELRRFLQEKLPEYMVPSAFVVLSALPLTPNGKLDQHSLPEPDATKTDLATAFVLPRNSEEKLLAKIWSESLEIEQVSIHDNFFELGGDSILAIGIVSKANQAGLQLAPKYLFQYQTIAELAAVAGKNPSIEAEQSPVTGSIPLTPIQHWFFEQNLLEPNHWNQSLLLEIRQVDPVILKQALQKLLEHHDALRLCFYHLESGWQQVNASPDQLVPFTHVDLSALSDTEVGAAIAKRCPQSGIAAAAAEFQASLNLSSGPLVRVAFFDLGVQPSRLLIIVHHLAIDGVSWRILLSDLQTAYQQLYQSETIQLPPKTTSFKQWAERLRNYVHSTALQPELDYWITKLRHQMNPIPVDFPGGKNTVAEANTVSVALSVGETKALLQQVPFSYQSQINDVLLTALVQAFEQWTGQRSLLIELEGHGREEIFDDVDLSRTVGWFTTLFPMLLELGKASSPGEALKSIKEQLRSIPARGIGYGLLRYLSSEIVKTQLQALPQAEVRFNYLGQTDQVFSQSPLFAPAQEFGGPACSPRDSRSSLIEIDGIVTKGQLRLDWRYSKAIHRQVTIENLAQKFVLALRELIAHCLSPDAGGYTPSDFPQMQFSQEELDQLLGEL